MSNNITTPAVRVSYPTVFAPRAVNPGDTPKYGVVLMFEKGNPEHMENIKRLHQAAQDVFNEKWPDPNDPGTPRIPLVGHDRSPIKDGDKALNAQGIPISEKNPEYAGHWIIRANTTSRPMVVDRNKAEVLDSNIIYGGCFCKVNINPYAYDTAGNKGVTFGLNGVQFWGNGESFGGGRPPVDDMFDSAGADDPANYAGAADDPFGGSPQGQPPSTGQVPAQGTGQRQAPAANVNAAPFDDDIAF